ncbi:MAG: hypothetical protein JZD41_08020, partial [Thermoproteus sp.]|nr:hypothetical protein [Thermoproteus sp.]
GVLDTNGRPIFAAVVLVPTATGTGGVANASYIAGLTTVPPSSYSANVYDINFNLCKSVTVNPYDDLMAYCSSGVGKITLSGINTSFQTEIINNAAIATMCVIDPPGGSCSIPTQPPTSQPPTSQPPTSQPPTSQPPTSQPPTSQPPTSQPPTSQPTTSQPPTSQPPPTQPPPPPPPQPPGIWEQWLPWILIGIAVIVLIIVLIRR